MNQCSHGSGKYYTASMLRPTLKLLDGSLPSAVSAALHVAGADEPGSRPPPDALVAARQDDSGKPESRFTALIQLQDWSSQLRWTRTWGHQAVHYDSCVSSGLPASHAPVLRMPFACAKARSRASFSAFAESSTPAAARSSMFSVSALKPIESASLPAI